MIKVVGVKFRDLGKVYYFDPKDIDVKKGDYIIVETARGQEFGFVAMGIKEVPDESITSPLKDVVRIATEEDKATVDENTVKEKEAYKLCQQKIKFRELDMKLIDVEYAFDRSRIMFYFTADERVDFRELVKDLATTFRTRIELRQIGVRDEAKILGGISICGRPLCCHTYLSDFAPVSIKMAKEQGLSLNPTKISGACGRLMCCLRNEQDTYEYLDKRMPNRGDIAATPDGYVGEVTDLNVLRQLVKVLVDENGEKEIREYPVDDLRIKPRGKKKNRENIESSDENEEPVSNEQAESQKEEITDSKPDTDEIEAEPNKPAGNRAARAKANEETQVESTDAVKSEEKPQKKRFNRKSGEEKSGRHEKKGGSDSEEKQGRRNSDYRRGKRFDRRNSKPQKNQNSAPN